MIKAIIEHMNVTSKEKLLAVIDAASQPNPQAQQMQQAQQQAQIELQKAQIAVLMAQAEEAKGRAAKYVVETEIMPKETVLKYSDMDKDGKVDDDFEKKVKLAQMLMDEDRWNVEKEERQARLQGEIQDRQRKAQDQDLLRNALGQNQDLLSQVQVEDEAVLGSPAPQSEGAV